MFERTAVRVEDPTVSLTKDGRIALNAAASRLLQKAGAKAVRILWDRTTCGIALQVAQKGDKNAFSVSFNGRSHTITAKRFLEYIGWKSDRRQTFEARWNAQQKMLETVLPPRLVKVRGDRQAKPVLASPTPGAHPSKLNLSNDDVDPFGGNINNRNAAEHRLNDPHTAHSGDPEKVRADIAKSRALNPDPVRTGR
jgi:hypothetical protein